MEKRQEHGGIASENVLFWIHKKKILLMVEGYFLSLWNGT